ncbi:hypothetical protein AAEX28_11860 [Lentisphaerota bacterium WC36G]|nr:hypothetical protein LJT99_14695 [Lentisphaerae bacterium WC36]
MESVKNFLNVVLSILAIIVVGVLACYLIKFSGDQNKITIATIFMVMVMISCNPISTWIGSKMLVIEHSRRNGPLFFKLLKIKEDDGSMTAEDKADRQLKLQIVAQIMAIMNCFVLLFISTMVLFGNSSQ